MSGVLVKLWAVSQHSQCRDCEVIVTGAGKTGGRDSTSHRDPPLRFTRCYLVGYEQFQQFSISESLMSIPKLNHLRQTLPPHWFFIAEGGPREGKFWFRFMLLCSKCISSDCSFFSSAITWTNWWSFPLMNFISPYGAPWTAMRFHCRTSEIHRKPKSHASQILYPIIYFHFTTESFSGKPTNTDASILEVVTSLDVQMHSQNLRKSYWPHMKCFLRILFYGSTCWAIRNPEFSPGGARAKKRMVLCHFCVACVVPWSI
jgi:hypothetical protein